MRRPSDASRLLLHSGACTVTFPQYSAPGAWTLGQVYLDDEANNVVRLTAADLEANGYQVSLTVASTVVDIAPPTLTAFSFTPTVEVGTGSATVTVNATVTDAQSGVWELDVEFTSPSGGQSQVCYIFPPGVTTPSTLTGSCTFSIPLSAEVGQWKVELYSSDSVWNYFLLGSDDLAALGFPSVLEVTSGS